MPQSSDNLTYDVRDRAAWINVNRPEKLNALNRQTVEEPGRAADRAFPEKRKPKFRGR